MSAPVLDAPTRPAPRAPQPGPPTTETPRRAGPGDASTVRVLLGLLTVLAGAWAWWRIYPAQSLPVPALAGALLGTGAVVLADKATHPQTLARPLVRTVLWLLAAATAGLVTALSVAVPRATSPADAVNGVVSSLTGGLARILTTTLPAPPAPDLLPQYAVLCALAAAVTAAIARTRGGLALAAPAACLLVTGLVCGVGGAGSPLRVSLPFVIAVGLLVLPRPRLVPAAVTAVVLALGCAAGLLASGAARDPLDPRHLTAPPLRAEQPTAPMDEIAGWLRHSRDIAFTATVDSSWRADPQPWRIAALDTYDGIRWTSSTPAVPIGYDLPVGEAETTGTARVSVTPGDLDGVYVPVSGRLRHLARPGMTYDLTGETLVDPDGVHGTYEQTVALPSRTGLDRASAGGTGAGAASRALNGCTDASLLTLASTAVEQAGPGAFAQAEALQTWFHDTAALRLDPDAEPGTSCARVTELLGSTGGNGTPDQFATAYVLMARSLGLPARVAAGFEAGTPDKSGRVTVTFGDATAWPEIWLDGAGWVAFDAVPDRTGSGPSRQEEKQESTTKPPTQPNDEDDATDPDRSAAGDAGGDEASSSAAPLVGLGIGLGALLVLLPLAGLVLTLNRRRRRRGAGPLGAWAELLDRLADLGHPSAGRTTQEIRRTLEDLDARTAPDAKTLAGLVDAEVYGPGPGGPNDAWNRLRAIEKHLSGLTPVWRRVLRRADPRRRRWA
ncbi:transglutaminase-like domain-containing protein [Kineosporia succinea]|uniref:Transglutaminase-like putative cysteine protease n=1 Tax=Kineosporia succinea TaxID=84632 RepID=A0ABT9PD78_9ACTN|nr:transglutaminase-like domain-containing protein [Kineosporia succinea]MDP9830650.1 transglutaminase-like putative cysteine protease [Kineosporia succinea]